MSNLSFLLLLSLKCSWFSDLIGFSLEKEDRSGDKCAFADAKSKSWRALVSTALAAAVVAFGSDMSALADLNKYEAETRGEFGIGSAAQFGSADLRSISQYLFLHSPIFSAFSLFCGRGFNFLGFWLCRKAVHVNENFR